jgi:SAM-dependent methyltransferase
LKQRIYAKRVKRFTAEQLRRGAHRKRVGLLWDEVGKLQFDFMVAQGLQPHDRFLDVGCGALRGGVRFVGYLDEGNYYGIDINKSLLEAGYDMELTDELRSKLPRKQLRRTNRFDCDFGVQFDAAIAQSLFTHLPLNDIRLCLYRVAAHMKIGGHFFATFFEAPGGLALDAVLDEGTRVSKFSERNHFWYWPGDLEWAASFSPWEFRYVGDWGHPRDQKMVEFVRVP